LDEHYFITMLFILTGIIDTYVYYPIIKNLLKFPLETAKNTHFGSWLWWSISGLVYISYYFIEIKDIPTIIISFNHFVGCSIVTYLTFKYRRKYKIKLF